MLFERERAQVVQYSQKMLACGLTRGTGGNISIRCGDFVVITPSGIDYTTMRAEDAVVVDWNGSVVEGTMKPSCEMGMHLGCYRARPDFGAIVHAHSTFAAVISCMRRPIPAIHYLVACAGGSIPCIPYYPFGSQELASAAAERMQTNDCILLGNHGQLAGGHDINQAFSTVEEIEFVSELYYRTELMGGGCILTPQQMEEAKRRFDAYGQK